MNILMVDDDPMVCESMRLILEMDGHAVDEAYSGSEALLKLAAGRFDLVFTDFFMPEMKGDKLAQAIRGRGEKPPIVMVTGFPPNPRPKAVAKVLIKPFDLQAIRGILSEFSVAAA